MTDPTGNFNYPSGPPPRRGPNPLLIVAGIVLALIVLCLIGIIVTTATGEGRPTSLTSKTVDPTLTPDPAPTVRKIVPSTPKPTKRSLPTSFKDGTFTAGKHIKAGTYRTSGATEGIFELCTWTVENATGKMVDFGSGNAGEPSSTTIKKGYTIDSAGCDTWRED